MTTFTIQQLRDQLFKIDVNHVFSYKIEEAIYCIKTSMDQNGVLTTVKILDNNNTNAIGGIKLTVTPEKVYYDPVPYGLSSTYSYYTITLTKASVRIENGLSGMYGFIRLNNRKSIEQLGKTVMRALLNKENIKDIF